MLDLKDTASFMYTMIVYFTWDGFGEVNVMKIVNENVVQQGFCLQMYRFPKHVTHYRCSKLFIVK